MVAMFACTATPMRKRLSGLLVGGVAEFPGQARTSRDLLERADRRL